MQFAFSDRKLQFATRNVKQIERDEHILAQLKKVELSDINNFVGETLK